MVLAQAYVVSQRARDKELIEAGKITPAIDPTYPLSATPGAIRYIGERHTQGKTVITV